LRWDSRVAALCDDATTVRREWRSALSPEFTQGKTQEPQDIKEIFSFLTLSIVAYYLLTDLNAIDHPIRRGFLAAFATDT
jgi:hypothetical protein